MLVLGRGNKVEVFSKNVADVGAWVCAEVMESDLYTCTVRYGGAGEVVETLPRRATRPCPPHLEVEDDLQPGDAVEFYDWISWKTATFLKALTEDNFLIRLVGELVTFVVDKSFLRRRQSWTGNRWYLRGNNSLTTNIERRVSACAKRKQCTNCSPIKKSTRAQRRRLEDKPLLVLDEDDRESSGSTVGSFSPSREVVHDSSTTSRREGNDDVSSDAESSNIRM